MESLSLVHSASFPIGRYSDALRSEDIALHQVGDLSQIDSSDGSLSVVLLDRALAGEGRAIPSDPRVTIIGIGLHETPMLVADDRIYFHLPENPPTISLLSAIRRAYQHLAERVRSSILESEVRRVTRELEETNKIGIALSTVRDHDVLLTMILSKSRELSRADAGSLYLMEEDPEKGKVLRWMLAQNDSIPVSFSQKVLQITKKSLAGYVALTGETLVIDDAYRLPPDVEYSINTSFDRENKYLTKSLLVFPMTNHQGDVIGVIQLINRKRDGAPRRLTAADVPEQVISFDEHTIRLMRSLGGQAAVALENNLLYESIERLFEGFVTASVTAIEQRDPTTSGHSFRVADLTVELARTVDRTDTGVFRDVHFDSDAIREIRYASLLHDFGKVGVREKILIKEKKLYPRQIDVIRSRFEYVMKNVESSFMRKKLDFLMQNGMGEFEQFNRQIEAEMAEQLAKLRLDLEFVVKSNEPTVLPEGEFQHLQLLGNQEYETYGGEKQSLLTEEEVKVLSIRKGNLDAEERGEIESHVTHTFRFLSKIPWTKDLMNVPDIAYAHHEKINGRGYPRGLPGASIPIQSRMMTVSDIYDALTATDRPYKRAVPTDRALDILKMEVKDGLLDHTVVDLFIEAKIFERAGILRTKN
jgi:HD-GYP domain-containing protein (c-di-GMP phosphodiesterase class II)